MAHTRFDPELRDPLGHRRSILSAVKLVLREGVPSLLVGVVMVVFCTLAGTVRRAHARARSHKHTARAGSDNHLLLCSACGDSSATRCKRSTDTLQRGADRSPSMTSDFHRKLRRTARILCAAIHRVTCSIQHEPGPTAQVLVSAIVGNVLSSILPGRIKTCVFIPNLAVVTFYDQMGRQMLDHGAAHHAMAQHVAA